MRSWRRPSGDPIEPILALMPVAPIMGRAGEAAVFMPISRFFFVYDGEVIEKTLVKQLLNGMDQIEGRV